VVRPAGYQFSPSYNSVYETIYNIYKLGTGEIFSGRVTDPCGNPISDVNVHEAGLSRMNPFFSRLTDAKGIYFFYGVILTKALPSGRPKPVMSFPATPAK